MRIVIIAVFAILMTSCLPAQSGPIASESLPSPTLTLTHPALDDLISNTKVPQSTKSSPPEVQMTPTQTADIQKLIDLATNDLAVKLATDPSEIMLMEATAVTWPNSSLGCPQDGMVYAEVLTPGYLIVLKFGEELFEYHTSHDNTIVTCPNPSPPVPGAPGNT